jgi:hypothetical protein
MGVPNRQIGWSNESNLIWQICKQLEILTGVTFTAAKTQPVAEIDMSAGDYTITSMGIYELNNADGNYNLTLPDPALFKGQRLVLINTSASNFVNITGPAYPYSGGSSGTLDAIGTENIFELVSVGDKWRVMNSVFPI